MWNRNICDVRPRGQGRNVGLWLWLAPSSVACNQVSSFGLLHSRQRCPKQFRPPPPSDNKGLKSILKEAGLDWTGIESQQALWTQRYIVTFTVVWKLSKRPFPTWDRRSHCEMKTICNRHYFVLQRFLQSVLLSWMRGAGKSPHLENAAFFRLKCKEVDANKAEKISKKM